MVVVATGLKLNMLGDIAITVDGPAARAGRSIAYKGMMLSDVPEHGAGLRLHQCLVDTEGRPDRRVRVCRLLRYMDRHGRRIAVARRDGW